MTTKIPKRTSSTTPDARVAGDFSLRYLLEILFRRKRVFILPLILTPILSFLISLAIKSSYMSSSTILVGKEDILNPLVRYETAVSMTDYNRLGSFEKILYSRPLIEEAVHKLDIDKGIKSDIEMEWAVNNLRRNIHLIGLASDSFQIGCTAADPQMAKKTVQAITSLFIEKSLQGSRRETMAAVTFIQKELDRYERELERTEKELQEFRQKNAETLQQMMALGGQLHDYNAKRLEAELDLKQEQLNEKLLTERLTGEKPMVVSQTLFVQNTPYQRHYQELSLSMGNLLATRDRSHPEVQKLQREMDYITNLLEDEKKKNQASETQEVRSPVYQEVTARLEDARIKIRVLEQKITEYSRLGEETHQKLLVVPELEKEQRRLDGEVKLTREIYENLRMKLEQARVSCEVEIEQQASRFTIIDPPLAPLTRYKPIRKMFMIGGVVGGVCLGFLIVFLLEFTDPRLVRPGEITRRLGVPVIGALPKLYCAGAKHPFGVPRWLDAIGRRMLEAMQRPGWQWSWTLYRRMRHGVRAVFCARLFELPASVSADLVVSAACLQQAGVSDEPEEEALDDFIERIRFILISARAAYEAPERLVWMVASARAGEGKTVMIANLGVVLASDVKKPVVLVDANFQRPDLSARFGRKDAPGLGEVVDGLATLEAALVATSTPNLSVLPAGHTAEYPDVLFNSAAFANLLEQLRERFALVLIETPNLMAHTEGMIIAPQTDGVLLLSRLYATKTQMIESVVRRLPREKVIGVVVNYFEYWIPEWLYKWV